jgi:3-oxoacyl-[acyl-carrier-protein] synthase-3
LFNGLGISPSSIDGIVFVSQTPDYILPATSAALQHRLGIPIESVAFDINYGCSGYIYGLFQAALLVSTGACENVLVCAGDVTTQLINHQDRSVRMLFGDAGSASLVSKGENSMAFNIKTDGAGGRHLIIPAGGMRYPRDERSKICSTRENGNIRSDDDLFMDGMEIMSFALKEVPGIIDELLDHNKWSKDDVGTFGFHQANRFMLNYLRKKMKLPEGKVPVVVEGIGNSGPASIPVMLTDESVRSRDVSLLGKVVLCGFGVGLSWGAVGLDLTDTILIEHSIL